LGRSLAVISRSYRYRFYPTQKQVHQLAKEFGCARYVYNRALAYRSEAYKLRGERLNYVGLGKCVTDWKKTDADFLKEVTACCLIQALIDLDKGFKNFFEKRAKYPRFKKKDNRQSVRYQLDQRIIATTYKPGFLRLPKLGEVKLAWSRMPTGIPKMATVSRDCAGRYWVSMSVSEEIQQLPMKTKSVGVDVGIKDVAVSSDGYHSGAPKFTRKYERKLARQQRKLSRMVKGSNRWKDKKLTVAKVHAKIADCRKDWTHKLTHKLIAENGTIGMEDLNVKGMMANRRLSKAVADSGLFEFRRQIEYKAAWHGRTIVFADRWFASSKTCSCCGQIKADLKLSDRVYDCDCGLTIDRDENAAKNLLKLIEIPLGLGEVNVHRLPNKPEASRLEAA